MNKAILIGNLGADPELRQVGDSAVCNMRIATTDSFKDKDGKRQERTDWHNVSAWGPQGESCAKFLRKGSKVGVEGQIQTRSYDKDGQRHYATEIRASHVEFLDGKRDDGGGGYRQDDRGRSNVSERDMREQGRPPARGRSFA